MTNARPMVVELFRHNLWANAVMLDACHDLSDEQFATELAGTYGRLDRTLVYLARAQGGYLRTMADWQPDAEHRMEYDDPFPASIASPSSCASPVSARSRSRGMRRRFAYWRAGVSARRTAIRSGSCVLHAAHHATEHRQQIATMLTNLGIQPPEPDPVAYWDSIQSTRYSISGFLRFARSLRPAMAYPQDSQESPRSGRACASSRDPRVPVQHCESRPWGQVPDAHQPFAAGNDEQQVPAGAIAELSRVAFELVKDAASLMGWSRAPTAPEGQEAYAAFRRRNWP